ncbi:Non-specific serine/threonine protein kinase [Bertholletia excelsa]
MKPEKWVFKLLLFLFFGSCISVDTITSSRPLKDGELLISDGKNFVLGFFSPGKSSFRYVGIWYYKVSEQTVVWVANRDRPINGSAGVLLIGEDGNLVVQESNQSSPLWRTTVSAIPGTTSSAGRLLDSGNLILFGGENGSVTTWQSFDHPTDTLLPEMKFGLDRRTGLNRILTSWKSGDDPATGVYSVRVEPGGSAQRVLYRGSTRLWRSWPWIELGNLHLNYDYGLNVTIVDNDKEIFEAYDLISSSTVSRRFVDMSGHVAMVTWDEGKSEWVRLFGYPAVACAEYGHCGANGLCLQDDGHNFECSCLPGYEPKSAAEWNREGFLKVSNTKIPDTSVAQVQAGLSLAECAGECLRNCSCTAYAVANRGLFELEGDCIMWFGTLMDVVEYEELGLDFYVRVDAVELAQQVERKTQNSRGKKVGILVVSVVVISLSIVSIVVWFVIKRRKGLNILQASEEEHNLELPIFDLTTIVRATNNFSRENKIGEGGFGPVYKGYLSTEREIVVKRLSINSKQGVDEFKNEVILIAKLQHRNLVRLLGCCIHQEERMLVYEYMPNGSLDSFIFGVKNKKHKLLTWRRRLDIILGIARGLLYLHQDSRLRVIHRDLKTSNILLDFEMNPKISDFGLAKVIGGDQSSTITRRVVGT